MSPALTSSFNKPELDFLTMVATKLEGLQRDMSDIKQAQKSTAEAIAKLTLLEERQLAYQQALKEASKELEALKEKMAVMEIDNASQNRTGRLVDAGITGVVALVAMYAAKHLGLV